MRLTELHLEQFRSYEKLHLTFDESERQLFVGENGEGKSNLLEAISFLSMGRSCLRAQSEDVLRWGTDFFRVRGCVISDEGTSSTLEYVFQKSPRRSAAMFLQDVRTPLLHFIGALPTIVFLPQDLGMFTGSPSARRGFLDALLSQLKPDFAGHRIEYEQILKQRNALISRIADGEASLDELDLWDGRLATAAAALTEERDECIALFNETLSATVVTLGEAEWSGARILHERKTRSSDAASIEVELLELFATCRQKDIALRATTVGPHRDDWHIQALGHDIATFASRGQQRAALLALLLTSAKLFEQVRGERPVILLDDVLSEFDAHHQQALLTSLAGHQVMITSAHQVKLKGEASVWKVGDGKVERAELNVESKRA